MRERIIRVFLEDDQVCHKGLWSIPEQTQQGKIVRRLLREEKHLDQQQQQNQLHQQQQHIQQQQ